MNERIRFAWTVSVSAVRATRRWMAYKPDNVLFTIGFVAIVIGCALNDIAMAFWLPGSLVCGLMVLHRLLTVWKNTGGDSNA